RPRRVVAVVEVGELDLAAVDAAAPVDVFEVRLGALEHAGGRRRLAGEWAARADRDGRRRDARRGRRRRTGHRREQERGERDDQPPHRGREYPRLPTAAAARTTSGRSIISATRIAPKANVVGPACFVSTCGISPTTSARNSIRSAPSTAPQIEPKKPTTAPT